MHKGKNCHFMPTYDHVKYSQGLVANILHHVLCICLIYRWLSLGSTLI